MFVIKWIFYSFVAWGCSVTFFNSSIFVMIILTCILQYLSNDSFAISKEGRHLVVPMKIWGLGILLGVLLISIGKLVFQQDSLVIFGAAVFAISVSSLLISVINKFVLNKNNKV